MIDNRRPEYDSLSTGAGFVELEDWSFVRLSGSDRQAFFHNFCTNEIKKLVPGQTCEAFVLNSKGKILGFVHAIAGSESLLLTGPGAQATNLIAHLDMYLIREDVELVDATSSLDSLFVCGNQSGELLASIGIQIPGENQVCQSSADGIPIQIANVEIAGFGYLIIYAEPERKQLVSKLSQAGIVQCSPEALNNVRVEQKTPWFGIDVDDSNLPQELQRDEKAINFDKGCYLGQETVARIDARGRVNQLLVGVKFAGDPPTIGAELIHDGKSVGRVTSVAYSFRNECYLGLAYVRRGFNEPGTEIGNLVVL